MAGTPALFIDGKFIGCPRPQSKNCSFSQRLKSGHPPGDQAPGLRFFAIFGAKTSLLPSRIARNRPISETGSLLTLPSSAESAQGFVASLARPGGNTTGFTQMSAELDSKRLQLLHEIVPSVSRAAFLVNPNLTPSLDERFAKAEAAAKSLGITLRRVNAANPADLNTALPAIQASSSEALLVQNDPMLGPERSRISDFAVAHRLPTVFEGPGCGSARLGLFTYGSDLIENARLAAGYVSKILKGAKPADLPVQQPTRFQLIVNLKTARVLGLTVPATVLDLADEVIE
jgi:putative tryptophan/tyrosine transport system substrate-binding protein